MAAEEALFEEARRGAGLEDFGARDFREPLRVLLHAYDAESRLTPLGRTMVRAELLGALTSRLRVQEAWKRKPELLTSPVRQPIFILGLPRTGTTALHHLLAQDPDHQLLEYWLASAPGPRPPRETWPSDPRYRDAQRGLRMMYGLDPELRTIHRMTADGPDECRHLFVQSFLDHTFDHNATIPSYTRFFAAQPMDGAYARHRDVLKLIQAETRERRWVLKYPAHLRNLEVLLATYPDACLVQTHRDPARVLPSICSLVAGWRGLYEDDIDPGWIGRWQLDFLASMVERAIEVRARSAQARFFDLSFAELRRDPIAAVGRLYDHFGFTLSAEAERRMVAWHAQQGDGESGSHVYRSADFGLSPETIRERFKPYTERFEVAAEPLV